MKTAMSKRVLKTMPRPRSYVKPMGITLLALMALLLIGLHAADNKDPLQSPEEKAVALLNENTLQLSDATLAELGTVKASIQDFPKTLDIMGAISVVENLVTVVPSRVNNGRVDDVLKVTGEGVRAGEPMARIFSPDYVSAREEYLQVISGGAGSDDGLRISKNEPVDFVGVARKKLEMMGLSEADIASLPSNSDDHLIVRAPRNGVITSVNTMVGNIQNQGDTLFTTANLDKVWFSGDLYIEDLPKLRRGQRILIKAEGLDKPMRGEISFISPVVDANVRTVKVRAMIENSKYLLRASMFVKGTVILEDEKALVVPQAAVLTLYEKTYCFKSIGQNRFERVPVTVSREGDAVDGIAQGLAAGDLLVASDLLTLNHVLEEGKSGE